MGVKRRFGRQVQREDMDASAYDGVKRDASGNIQFTGVATKKGTTDTGLTGITATGAVTSTNTSRAIASKVKLAVSTANTPTAGTVKVKRNGNTPASVTGLTTTKTTTVSTKTFTLSPATWTVSVTAVGGGSLSIKTWSQSREDRRS